MEAKCRHDLHRNMPTSKCRSTKSIWLRMLIIPCGLMPELHPETIHGFGRMKIIGYGITEFKEDSILKISVHRQIYCDFSLA